MSTPLSRTAALGLAGLALAVAVPGQKSQDDGADPRQQALVEKRDAKLASEFIKKADWLTDYDKALASAKTLRHTAAAV